MVGIKNISRIIINFSLIEKIDVVEINRIKVGTLLNFMNIKLSFIIKGGKDSY